jgi:hypothetical protein
VSFINPTLKNEIMKETFISLGLKKSEVLGKSIIYNINADEIPNELDEVYCDFNKKVYLSDDIDTVENTLDSPTIIFDHVAVAVTDIKSAINSYQSMGFEVSDYVHDKEQNVYLAMCTKPGSCKNRACCSM